jgi:hypothetical protein
MIALVLNEIAQNSQRKWKREWEEGDTSQTLYKLTKEPTKHNPKRYKGMPMPLSSILVAMRIGKIGLWKYLYKWKVPGFDSPICDQCSMN